MAANASFQFKQFMIQQDRSAMKVTTDSCLFGSWVAARARNFQSGLPRLLDIGTGTGLLSLMLAQKLEGMIDAVELDPAAARQAAENSMASPWKKRINVIQKDAKIYNTHHTGYYDLIISNPPFYENELQSPRAQKNIAHHSQALLLSELLAIIRRLLSPEGQFYILLPFKRRQELEMLCEKNELSINHCCRVKQSILHVPFRIMFQGQHNSKNEAACTEEEIAIKDQNNNYTPAFTELLKDYYLYL